MTFLSKIKTNIFFLMKFTRFMYWVPTLQQNLTAAFLLLFLTSINETSLLNLLFFAVMQVFLLTYIFVVNDVGDKEIDVKAGKIKAIQKYSKKRTALIVLGLIAGFLFIPFYYGNLSVIAASIFTLFLATFYSIKPIRFKEHGAWGIIVADFSQRSALFFIFALLVSAPLSLTTFFMGWLFIIGFQDELNHQVMDISADKKSNAKTWIQHIGKQRGERFLLIALAFSFVYLLIPFLMFNVLLATLVSFTLFIFRALTTQFIYDHFF